MELVAAYMKYSTVLEALYVLYLRNLEASSSSLFLLAQSALYPYYIYTWLQDFASCGTLWNTIVALFNSNTGTA